MTSNTSAPGDLTALKLAAKGFLAGALTGVVGVILPYPFESFRLQLLFAASPKDAPQLQLLDRQVWSGLSGALLQGVALRGVTFGTYDFILRQLSVTQNHQGGSLKV